jgi:hypothetical protein
METLLVDIGFIAFRCVGKLFLSDNANLRDLLFYNICFRVSFCQILFVKKGKSVEFHFFHFIQPEQRFERTLGQFSITICLKKTENDKFLIWDNFRSFIRYLFQEEILHFSVLCEQYK